MAQSKPYHHGNLHQALIDAGLAILAEDGVKALTLRKVARRAGVSHAAPYRHFKDKDALLVEIGLQGFQKLSTQMQTGFNAHKDEPAAQFIAIGLAYVLFAGAYPAHFKVMFALSNVVGSKINMGSAELASALSATQTRLDNNNVREDDTFLILILAIQNCRQAKIIHSDKTMALAFSAWSMVHGIATLLNTFDSTSDQNNVDSRTATTYQSLNHLFMGFASI